jgi:hypothetical protein
MKKDHNGARGVHVTHAKEQHAPEHIRRVGRAIIALARAQLEAEAEAEHQKTDTTVDAVPPVAEGDGTPS